MDGGIRLTKKYRKIAFHGKRHTMEGLMQQLHDWIDYQGSVSSTIEATCAQAALVLSEAIY